MERHFVISTEEHLSQEDRKLLFECWLIVRAVNNINFPDWLKLQGYKLLFSIKEFNEHKEKP